MPVSDSFPLYLFAKTPVPGQVKTRLEPQLGPAGAAELALRMLEKTLATTCQGWPGKVMLCVWPNREDAIFRQLSRDYAVTIECQQDADLGERMMYVLEQGIAEFGAAAVIGCDLPALDVDILDEAYDQLRRGKNVIGPAEDGGFYFLGLQNAERGLFEGIHWGDENVLAQLQRQADFHGVRLSSLKTLRDIDEWPDFLWLLKHDPSFGDLVESNHPINHPVCQA